VAPVISAEIHRQVAVDALQLLVESCNDLRKGFFERAPHVDFYWSVGVLATSGSYRRWHDSQLATAMAELARHVVEMKAVACVVVGTLPLHIQRQQVTDVRSGLSMVVQLSRSADGQPLYEFSVAGLKA
jgi:hypothetical protein